ncbi:MAG: putative metal-binding motif-containing protein, partial [Polaribacter sp.]|nr:putative metal-binding motif-containing protein [Polaribacter sp.]
MNKKGFTILIALLLTISSFAQAPEKISYQAVVRGATNAAVATQVVGMQISVLQTTATGTAVYVETQMPTTNANGLLSIYIGAGTPVTGTFAGIDWSAGPYFIKTEIDPTGGSSYTITGTSQLLSVPYALHTKEAANGLPSGGTDGQVLAINASGAPEWTNPSTGQTYYEDADDDGYGDINSAVIANVAPNGYVDNNTDCNDNDAAINPTTIWYIGVDTDGDTFFGSTTSLTQCESPGAGYTTAIIPLSDCNDTDVDSYPGALEILGDEIDNNCDGRVDEIPAIVGDFRDGGIVFWVDPNDNTRGKVCYSGDLLRYQGIDYRTDWV